jgi:hypothetical protein
MDAKRTQFELKRYKQSGNLTDVMELPVCKLLRGKELRRIQGDSTRGWGSFQRSTRWSGPGHSALREYAKTGRAPRAISQWLRAALRTSSPR